MRGVPDSAAERSITWDQVKDMPEDEGSIACSASKGTGAIACSRSPIGDYVHKEMAKVGVNLRLLHDEYETECRSRCDVAMGCTKFCEGYGSHVVANSLTKRIEHKAGTSCEVGWSGPTLGKGPVNPATGEASKIYLFVGVLPFNQKAYFEQTLDMKERTRLALPRAVCASSSEACPSERSATTAKPPSSSIRAKARSS